MELEALGTFLPFILIIGVFYLLIMRPQKKRADRHRDLLSSLEPMDRVVTNGGLHGVVQGIDDGTVRLEIAPGTTVVVAKMHIIEKITESIGGSDGDV